MASNNPIIITKGSGPRKLPGPGSGGRLPRLPGTLPSTFRYGEQVISTGLPSLDAFIGGGLPLGTVTILKDTFPSRFADAVLKCFIAEGATHNHHIYISAGREEASTLLNELPVPTASSSVSNAAKILDPSENNDGGDLRIAWRYGHNQTGLDPSRLGQRELARFDFAKKTTARELGAKHAVVSGLSKEDSTLSGPSSLQLLEEIKRVAESFRVPDSDGGVGGGEASSSSGGKTPTNVLRICLSHCEEQILDPKFLIGLRTLMRRCCSAAVVTLSDLTIEAENLWKCEHFADYVISLTALADEKRRSELGEIDGVCEVQKAVSPTTFKPVLLPKDIGFSFKKRKLVFHEISLPPEGESTVQREVSARHVPPVQQASSCGASIKGKSIDF